MTRTLLALLLSLVLALPAAARDEVGRTPFPDSDGAALAEQLRKEGCPGCELNGKDLSGQNLDGANLAGAIFNTVNLTGATCHGCNLQGAHFGMVQLDGADLDGADLRKLTSDCSPFFAYTQCQQSTENPRVTLRKANLAGADLSGIIDLDVTGAKAEGTIFHVAFPPTLAQAEFTTVMLAPEYGSEAKPQPFDKAEITALAGFVKPAEYSWVPLQFEFGEGLAQAHTPSFDCAKAGSETEKALCEHTELALLDRMLSAAYAAARKADGADKDALKKEQLAWMKTRNACGAEWGCLSETMRGRITALVKQLGPSAVVKPGRYEPSYAEPQIWSGVATSETGTKLRKLMRYDATSIHVKDATGGVMKVEAFSLGGNGHMCSIEEGASYLFDPTTGQYRYGEGEGVPEDDTNYGVIVAIDRYLLFSGGMYWCGARASLDGIYLQP